MDKETNLTKFLNDWRNLMVRDECIKAIYESIKIGSFIIWRSDDFRSDRWNTARVKGKYIGDCSELMIEVDHHEFISFDFYTYVLDGNVKVIDGLWES
jgi:hypothetical protein